MKFRTTLQRFGANNTGIEVPEEILAAFGRGRRVKVVATVNGYAYRTSVAPAMGKILMPFSSEHRTASGLSGGEEIEVEIIPDDAPREVELPVDLATALDAAPRSGCLLLRALVHQQASVRALGSGGEETRDALGARCEGHRDAFGTPHPLTTRPVTAAVRTRPSDRRPSRPRV